MGKPFARELEQVENTANWADSVDIKIIEQFVKESCDSPLIAIGSGGSFSVSVFASMLHEIFTGCLSKAVTPLQFLQSPVPTGATVLIITAGGNNSDILSATEKILSSEQRSSLLLCMKKRSKAEKLVRSKGAISLACFELPSGKDGFLATNSLVASAGVIARAYTSLNGDVELCIRSCFKNPVEGDPRWCPLLPVIAPRRYCIALYSRSSAPAAVDLESKLVEAGLGSVLLSDYRNFAHGRHNWIARKRKDSYIVAFGHPEEAAYLEKTAKLIPADVPIVRMTTELTDVAGTLHLMGAVLHFVNDLSISLGLDPGRPSVPEFGRKLYHLKVKNKREPINMRDLSIRRKTGGGPLTKLSKFERSKWNQALSMFIRSLAEAKYCAAVFDYDGTLCGFENRFIGLSDEVGAALKSFASEGFVIGIATGRGRSAGKALREAVPQALWGAFIVGYYNGAVVLPLCDSLQAVLEQDPEPGVAEMIELLEDKDIPLPDHDYEARKWQISVVPKNASHFGRLGRCLKDLVADISGLRVLESSHSWDVLISGVSKLAVVDACQGKAKALGLRGEVLRIGDRGESGGNDFELLNSPYGLSVAGVSANPRSCWNLSSIGSGNVTGTLEILKDIRFEDLSFRFSDEFLERFR